MNVERATQIIEAYGADPARWPDDERAGVLALAGHPRVSAAVGEAAALDRDLRLWAAVPVAPGDPLGAADKVLTTAPSWATPWRWAAGSGIAAAVLAGVLLIGPQTTTSPQPQQHISVATATTGVSDEQAYSLLFTPTPDEENAI